MATCLYTWTLIHVFVTWTQCKQISNLMAFGKIYIFLSMLSNYVHLCQIMLK